MAKFEDASLRHMVEVQVADVSRQILAVRCKQNSSLVAGSDASENFATYKTADSYVTYPPLSEMYNMDTLLNVGIGASSTQSEQKPLGRKVILLSAFYAVFY